MHFTKVVFTALASASLLFAGSAPSSAQRPTGHATSPPTGDARPGRPSYADFVHMMLMSDASAYLADAARTGLAYIAATGSEADCRRLYDVSSRGDEFARREYFRYLSEAARRAIADLSNKPRRLEISVETTYALGEYDFNRQGFPFAPNPPPQFPILAAGTIALPGNTPRNACRAGYYTLAHYLQKQSAATVSELSNLSVQHDAVREIDLLPMPPDEARAFREANAQNSKAGIPGGNRVLLKARLIVEPRDQGRGPLKGQIVAVAAYAPHGGRLLHTWDVQSGVPLAAPTHIEPASLSSEYLAAVVGPVAETLLPQQNFDSAAARYFNDSRRLIAGSNLPKQSPLPLEAIRNRQPELIVALNRKRLRAALHEGGVAFPVSVFVEQTVGPLFEEGKGLSINGLENDPGPLTGSAALSKVTLSGRELPLYSQLVGFRPSRRTDLEGFREAVLTGQSLRILLELDRVVRLPTVPLSVEQAAARGLLNFGGSTRRRDNLIARWDLELASARAEGHSTVIISANLRRLSYRWASDGAPAFEVAINALPTVELLQQQAEAALPPAATAEKIIAPSAGARLGPEIMDLLQLRYQPQTVDDRVIQRMLLTRFSYETASKGESLLWGHFFRDPSKPLSARELTARRDEFRRWSEARASVLPRTLTVVLPLADTPNGKVAPFERQDRRPPDTRGESCNPGLGIDAEKGLAVDRICSFLDAAWKTPEPLLFLPGYGERQGPRYACGNGDSGPYCREMYNAHVGMKLPVSKVQQDIIRLDRLPILDAKMRGGKGRLAIELVIEPTGLSAERVWPDGVYADAVRKAAELAKTYNIGVRPLEQPQPSEPVIVLAAHAVSARLIDLDSGLVVGEPPLTAPRSLPLDMLDMPKSKFAGHEVVGVRLGMSFADADRVIRAHMQVGKVLTADRKRQLSTVSGEIVPYTSGRMYATASGDEIIAIFDEPPSAPETVLGLWRILRVPHGTSDPATLKTTLAQLYGEPRVQEVSLPYMRKGLAFLWSEHENYACRPIDFGFQTDLWSDENGNTSWLPPPMTQALFPNLHGGTGTHGYIGVTKQPLPPGHFCSAFLGVRYAASDGKNAGEHNGIELVTWLTDRRNYADHYFKSRQAPPVAQPSASSGSGIKF